MNDRRDAIRQANAYLVAAGLPSMDRLVVLLRAAENKLSSMEQYHAGPAKQSIEAFRTKIHLALSNIPPAP